MKSWYLYVVKCKDNSLYTGITTDIQRRINEHNSGIGAKYTRSRGPVQLVHMRQYKNRSDASKAESKFKKLKRNKKIQIIQLIALPGDLVELSGRTSVKKQKYGLVVRVRECKFENYIDTGSALYDMSDGTTGFSYAYRKIKTRDFV